MIVLAAIQARLASTRLPQKVMLPILGKSMIQHLVERVRRSKMVTEVAVICPLTDIAEIGRAVDCKVYASAEVEESDLVHRHWDAAQSFGANLVVRVPSDNPCVDPVNIDAAVEFHLKNGEGSKLTTNLGDYPKAQWPQGLGCEVYKRELLKWLFDMTRETDPALREHPHLLFHNDGDYKEPPCPHLPDNKASWYPPLRFDVNTVTDFYHMETLFDYFGNNTFSTADLIKYETPDSEENNDVNQGRAS